ncbi:hypothetical protein WA026_021924 [Henosepilachna vigintioctopunctata]|uniref:Protein takeout n=1 Tax=Henosepilachna vigintioctopunctata TaxID=420089 RepID=A0AAW1VBZ8_9CUCU
MTSLRKFSICVSVLIIVSVSATIAAKLPQDWIKCSLTKNEAEDCLGNAVEYAISHLKSGAPDLTIASLEPLLIPSLTIGAGTGPVNVDQRFNDIKLHGLTGSKVLTGSADLENNVMFAQSITPVLRLEANYEMNGRILLLPIQGTGLCNITLINTAINHTLHTEMIQKKKKDFLNIKEYTVTLRPEKVIFHFDNLFNGDKRLGDEINRVMNENQEEVFADVRSGYERSFGLIFQDLANRVFSRVVIKDLFLD